jgi:uncharacterized 2Fe-2S/4Fe-4S cluster protein (DUF4445 family)
MIKIPKNVNILEYLRQSSYDIISPCNGIGKCGKCKVKIISPSIPLTKREKEVLTNEEINNNIRLACLHKTSEETEVELIQTNKKMHIIANVLDQFIKKPYINVIDGIVYRNQEPINEGYEAYGIIIDIGTTTCVVALVDIITHTIIDSQSFINPQTAYGNDVISRIGYASNTMGLKSLHQLIVTSLQDHIDSLLSLHKILENALFEIIVSANTTMNHLFLGVTPESMSKSPYKPVIITKQEIKASEIFKSKYKQALITVLPGFDAFVGGDIFSGILALELHNSQAKNLLIDLGTNGEIVLGNKERLYATSTAAGPAFEGVNINCGIGAINGALDNFIMFDVNNFQFTTIKEEPCIGICGSGLIDIVSSLYENKIVNKSGYLKEEFIISDNIKITPKDIREIQLAKSAIRAGVEVLLSVSKTNLEDIANIYISGGFGKHVDLKNLVNIGILPKQLLPKIVAVGNTSISGAYRYLMSNNYSNFSEIINKTSLIELDSHPLFQNLFIEYMSF